MSRFLELYTIPGRATFFMHQPYAILHGTSHELEPHPFPVQPDAWTESIKSLVERLDIKPFGVRTHSCITSHMLEWALHGLGVRYTSNTTRIFELGIRPSRSPWGLWELPIYYMDNLDLSMATFWSTLEHQTFGRDALEKAAQTEGLYVFDFHPLHILLNTPNLEYYLERSPLLKAGASPFDHRYKGQGVGTYFEELIQLMQATDNKSVALEDLVMQLDLP